MVYLVLGQEGRPPDSSDKYAHLLQPSIEDKERWDVGGALFISLRYGQY